MNRIHELLDSVAGYSAQLDPALRSVLQPGYSPAQIREIVPFTLPDEVVALYGWHNGMDDPDAIEEHRLFYYHHFLALEDAYRTYQELMDANQSTGHALYDPNLFPLFSFMGEWYMVQITPEATTYGSIWFVHQGAAQVYDSLTAMLEAINECYVSNAYRIENGDIVPDEVRVASIKARWNLCRWQADGTTLSDHP
jgi:hypothetical protein